MLSNTMLKKDLWIEHKLLYTFSYFPTMNLQLCLYSPLILEILNIELLCDICTLCEDKLLGLV